MSTRIEICTKEDESTTVKGGILERLVAQILTVQQFEVTQTVRVTGMEIDVYAKHKITNQVILVECKAHAVSYTHLDVYKRQFFSISY